MRTDLYFTGVVLRHGYAGGGRDGWWATIDWQDSRFCEPGCVQGTIATRYGEATPAAAIDAVLEVATTFGFTAGVIGTWLHYRGDGEDPQYPPPDGWREMVNGEANRRGWFTAYDSALCKAGVAAMASTKD